MEKYEDAKVKATDSQLSKLKSPAKVRLEKH